MHDIYQFKSNRVNISIINHLCEILKVDKTTARQYKGARRDQGAKLNEMQEWMVRKRIKGADRHPGLEQLELDN